MRGLRDPSDDPDGPRRTSDGAAPRDDRLGDRLLREDDALREEVWGAHPARAGAPVRDWGEAREPATEGPVSQWGRRRSRNRRRSLRECGPAEPGHVVRDP